MAARAAFSAAACARMDEREEEEAFDPILDALSPGVISLCRAVSVCKSNRCVSTLECVHSSI